MKLKNLKRLSVNVLALVGLLAGCAESSSNNTNQNQNTASAQSSSTLVDKAENALHHSSSGAGSDSNLSQQDATPYPSQTRSDQAIAPIRNQFKSLQFNGAGAYIVNNNQSTLGAVKPNGRPWAQNMTDNNGRAVQGNAYLTRQARQYRDRSQTGNGASSWKPAGYCQQTNLPGQYRFAYNRGHLLGYALVGNIRGFDASESNQQNIATQTMWANQAQTADNTGQNYYEGLVRKALDQNKFVRYQVKDLYVGSELVPRATQIQAKSSDGTLNFNVLVPNTQNNMTIDYATGNVTPCAGGSNAPRTSSYRSHFYRHRRF